MAAPAGRGWLTVLALVLAVLALSVVQPLPLVIVPLALLLVALPPRSPGRVALAAALCVVAFAGGSDGGDALWYAERGWALVLGAWFVVSVVVWPTARFLSRAMAATVAAIVTAAAIFLVTPGAAWQRLDWSMTRRLRGAAAEMAALWSGGAAGDAGDVGASISSAIRQAAELQALVYPALLALASVAGLAVAWWAFRRTAVREPRPLAPLREFRFRDELVWLVIVGILLTVLPLGGGLVRTGSNLLLFMGVLCALRGVGVLLVLAGGLGLGGVVMAVVAAVLLYPVAVAGTVLVGLSDTWLDLRSRGRSAAGPDS